jgi:3-oxoacyl-[acyl-carrier protein] reductase
MHKRIALVTGASRGIGNAIAVTLKKECAKVLTPTRMEMDLTSNESIDNYLSKLNEQIDIIVNNAGILQIGPCSELSANDFQNILQVNLVAPFRIISTLAIGMKHRKFGRIVNISSIWGTISKEGRSIYSASKAGLDGLTKSLAIELAPHNILVNAVAPGYVNTSLISQNNTKEELENIKKTIPMKRFAEPDEVAELVRFLCSEQNSYITGHILPIDGGYLCK